MTENKNDFENKTNIYSKIWFFLNSPFLLTLIGGGLIAYLTFSLQANEAKRLREMAGKERLYKYELKLLHSFASDFPVWLDLICERRKCQIEIFKNKIIYKKAKFINNIIDQEAVRKMTASKKDDYELLKFSSNIRSGRSYCYEIEFTFDTPQTSIKNQIDNLMNEINKVDTIMTQQELYKHQFYIMEIFAAICETMTNKVQNTAG